MSDIDKTYQEAVQRLAEDLDCYGFRRVEDSVVRWEGLVEVNWFDQDSQCKRHTQQKVAIEIGKGFPFQKPEVFPLDAFDEKARHRAPAASGGALCLYSARINGWMPSQTGHDLIERITEWFVHCFQNDWSDDDLPPDLHLYFPRTRSKHLAVYGDDWPPPPGQSGRFAIWEQGRSVVVSGARTGYDMPSFKPPVGLADAIGVNSSLRIVGIWFRLNNELTPAESLSNVLSSIDHDSSQSSGYAQGVLRAFFGCKLKREQRLLLAIGYPAHDGERWLFLEAILPAGKGRSLQWERRLAETSVRSLETAPSGTADILRRTKHTHAQLAKSQVAIFGLGALGSTVATLLAKSGVAELRAVDSDQLRPSNCVRHEAGIRLSGMTKAQAVGVEVLQHTPACIFESIPETWDADELVRIVDGCQVVIDATANDAFSFLLNEICVHQGVPFLSASSFRRASVGRLRVVQPLMTACLVCYTVLATKSDFPLIPPGDEGAFVEAGCGDPTTEASAIELTCIATQVAQVARDILIGNPLKGSECLIVNNVLSDVPTPLDTTGVHWFSRVPVPDCQTCGNVK